MKVWWTAIRPATLTLSLTPVITGIALALSEGAGLRGAIALETLIAALCIQIGVNLYNDATDCAADRCHRLGPLRVTAAGLASASDVRRAANLALIMAFLFGLHLTFVGGWPILLIGFASLVASWAYSGGQHPLSHTPLGEFFVWLFFGVMAVSGSHWLQAGTATLSALLAGAALGLPAAAVLLINNLRDSESDQRAGRRTLALQLGNTGSRRLYALLMLLPFALLLGLPSYTWFAFLMLPINLRILTQLRTAGGSDLNGILIATARSQFVFGLLIVAGCLTWNNTGHA
ncbi:MAG: 1,4-dihydroxy-2-naphthoate octaprenyltransferase [Rhodocyclaceae bacterium]|nr:1,4-dihydroxy-2-naphthoate octaprenyltransferase [Rhodocyclaceae bacterium]